MYGYILFFIGFLTVHNYTLHVVILDTQEKLDIYPKTPSHGYILKKIIQQNTDENNIVTIIDCFDMQGFSTHKNILQALDVALEINPDILVCCWQLYNLEKKIKTKFLKKIKKFKLLVTSAGNDGTSSSAFPAAFFQSSMINVGSYDANSVDKKLCSFNQGVCDIVMPGLLEKIVIDNRVLFVSGTSISAALLVNRLVQNWDRLLSKKAKYIKKRLCKKYKFWQKKVIYGTYQTG